MDFESQNQANLMNILANYTMQAQEAAAGRRMAASGAGLQAYGEPALAFAPTQVAGQRQGLLGGLLQTFSTLFPKFDLGSMFPGTVFNPGSTTPSWQGPIQQFPTTSSPYSTPDWQGPIDTGGGTPDVTVNIPGVADPNLPYQPYQGPYPGTDWTPYDPFSMTGGGGGGDVYSPDMP